MGSGGPGESEPGLVPDEDSQRPAPPRPSRAPATEGGREGGAGASDTRVLKEGRQQASAGHRGPPSRFGETGRVDSKEHGVGGPLDTQLPSQA